MDKLTVTAFDANARTISITTPKGRSVNITGLKDMDEAELTSYLIDVARGEDARIQETTKLSTVTFSVGEKIDVPSVVAEVVEG